MSDAVGENKMLISRFYIVVLLSTFIMFCVPDTYPDPPKEFLRGAHGEYAIGISSLREMDVDRDRNISLISSEGSVYSINLETKQVELSWKENSSSFVYFSPDRSKLLFIQQGEPNRYYVLDWDTKEILLKGEEDFSMNLGKGTMKYGMVNPTLWFSSSSKYLILHDKEKLSITLFNLENKSSLNVPANKLIREIIDIDPERQCATCILENRVENQTSTNIYSYTVSGSNYALWNYSTDAFEESIPLFNSSQFADVNPAGSESRAIYFVKPVLANNILVGVDAQVFYNGHGPTNLIAWDVSNGLEKYIPTSIDFIAVPDLNVSPNRRYLLVNGYAEGVFEVDTNVKYRAGPFGSYKGLSIDTDKKQVYSFDRDIDNMYGINQYDISQATFTEKYPLIDYSIKDNKAVFSPSNELLTYPDQNFNNRWDFVNNSVEYLSFPRILPEFYNNFRFSPKGDFLIGSMLNFAYILDSSSGDLIQSVTISENDSKNHVRYNHDGMQFLTASGRQDAPGVDNLIRIWNAETFEMQREIRGHSDSVWYAEFSPGDRRIVSASLDGTAKVWDAESGELIASFVAHASGVEYASFFPDGDRILSAGRDRKAYVWNAEAAEIERTFDGIHLPAQLSPDGKHLFAGSEVWDVETGERIKTLDGVAQDYSCLTLSPDGTMLLTSEHKGFTKVWNVQEHILKPAGVWDYSVYE